MAKKQYRHLWKVAREYIIEDYEKLAKHRIRESYYLVRKKLSTLIGTDISREEFDYLSGARQAYSSYRDEVWPSLEQKEGLERPKAKPYGTIYERGTEYPISALSSIWRQARGFVFTEKLEDGEDLIELSNYGWTIIAGGGFAGFPTRQIRQMLKADSRPVLAFHDCDIAGGGIYRALGYVTRRTRHLDIALGDRVTDLGLSAEDAQQLELPTEPEPRRHGEERRVETATLDLLEETMGIAQPKLAYVVAKMIVNGITLSPTEISKRAILHGDLHTILRLALQDILTKAVDDAMEVLDPTGTAVDAYVPIGEDIVLPELERLARDLAIKLGRQVEWRYEGDCHSEAQDVLTTPELIEILTPT